MPSRHLVFEIEVPAPIEDVWKLLMDFDAYPEWNSMISFKGKPAPGKKVPMKVSIMDRKIVTPVTFLRMDKNTELAWVGGIRGLFIGEHYFQLKKIDDNSCLLIQGEKFKGLMVGLSWPILNKTLEKVYTETNDDVVNYFKK